MRLPSLEDPIAKQWQRYATKSPDTVSLESTDLTICHQKVLTGPFLLRVLTLPKHEQLVPGFVAGALERDAPSFYRWAQAVTAEKSVTAIWDEELVVRRTLDRIAKTKTVA